MAPKLRTSFSRNSRSFLGNFSRSSKSSDKSQRSDPPSSPPSPSAEPRASLGYSTNAASESASASASRTPDNTSATPKEQAAAAAAAVAPPLPAKMSAMTSKSVAPYGTWQSPISADLLTQKNVSFGEIVVLDRSSSHVDIAYIENRPEESGRAALVKRSVPLNLLAAVRSQGKSADALTESSAKGDELGSDLSQGKYNVRSGVHEYGGGAVSAIGQGRSVFTDYKTFGVFEADAQGQLRKITIDDNTQRYADFNAHPTLPLILAVKEDHSIDEPSKVTNTLVAINSQSRTVTTLVSGNDFYTNPRLSPDGHYIAWVTWNHPSMPFWATELWVAELDSSSSSEPKVIKATKICGNNKNEVAHAPTWKSAETLVFTRDVSGFANPWTVTITGGSGSSLKLAGLKPMLKKPYAGDFISPAWTLGDSTFGFLSPNLLISAIIEKAFTALWVLHTPTGELSRIETPFVSINSLKVVGPSTILFTGTEATQPSSIILMELADVLKGPGGMPRWHVIKRSSTTVDDGVVAPEFFPRAEAIEFPTELPNGKISTAHALLFLPSNPNYAAPAGTAPPCVFSIHGGPTSTSRPGLSLPISFWTSRGYLFCSVNYGGSTSFGREFMERLNGQWGVVDVRDTIAAATFLGSTDSEKSLSPKSKGARRITSKGQAQLSDLQERRLVAGSVEYTLAKKASWSGAIFTVLSSAAFGAATTLLPHIDARLGVAAGGLLWLLRAFTQVKEESVLVTPHVGIQTSTVRGFQLPGLRASLTTSKSTRLIPRDAILDVITNEAVWRWGVVDYVSVATKSPRGASKSGKSAYGGRLQVLFPHILPRLPVVEHVYRNIYPIIFGDSSIEAASPKSINKLPRADPNKLAIRGGSDGGFTVLAALCLSPHTFSAGTDLYGVSKIAGLAEDSHKFESQYVDQLMGGPPAKIPNVYHDRSPLYMADRIRSPLLIMQGSIDKVVPPNQNIAIYETLKKQGQKTKYIEFEGEGHGFRMAANIKRSLEEEEAWYKEVFNL